MMNIVKTVVISVFATIALTALTFNLPMHQAQASAIHTNSKHVIQTSKKQSHYVKLVTSNTSRKSNKGKIVGIASVKHHVKHTKHTKYTKRTKHTKHASHSKHTTNRRSGDIVDLAFKNGKKSGDVRHTTRNYVLLGTTIYHRK